MKIKSPSLCLSFRVKNATFITSQVGTIISWPAAGLPYPVFVEFSLIFFAPPDSLSVACAFDHSLYFYFSLWIDRRRRRRGREPDFRSGPNALHQQSLASRRPLCSQQCDQLSTANIILCVRNWQNFETLNFQVFSGNNIQFCDLNGSKGSWNSRFTTLIFSSSQRVQFQFQADLRTLNFTNNGGSFYPCESKSQVWRLDSEVMMSSF